MYEMRTYLDLYLVLAEAFCQMGDKFIAILFGLVYVFEVVIFV